MNKKNNGKHLKKILAAALVLLLAAALAFVYVTFREKAVEGSKSITIEVIDNAAKSTVYSLKTDAMYLLQAMEEAEGLTFVGEEGPYGLMINTINGVTADYNVDAANEAAALEADLERLDAAVPSAETLETAEKTERAGELEKRGETQKMEKLGDLREAKPRRR